MLQTICHLLIRPRCFQPEREWLGGTRTHLTETPWQGTQLNPVVNIWQFVRDNWLSNRVFRSYDDIVALSCGTRNNLIDQPWSIISIGHRKWAHGF